MPNLIANLIEEWLAQEDRSQAHLARRARMAPETLSRILLGRQKAGSKVCRKLERAMGLAPGILERVQAQSQHGPNGSNAQE